MPNWICGICKANGIEMTFSEQEKAMAHLYEHFQKRGSEEKEYEKQFNELVSQHLHISNN